MTVACREAGGALHHDLPGAGVYLKEEKKEIEIEILLITIETFGSL